MPLILNYSRSSCKKPLVIYLNQIKAQRDLQFLIYLRISELRKRRNIFQFLIYLRISELRKRRLSGFIFLILNLPLFWRFLFYLGTLDFSCWDTARREHAFYVFMFFVLVLVLVMVGDQTSRSGVRQMKL
jgi:hypothetical protein